MTTPSTDTPQALGRRPEPTVSGRSLLGWAAAIAVLATLTALWTGSGRPTPAPSGLPDAGLATEWALPTVQVLVHLVGTLVAGLLLVPAFLIDAAGGQLSGLGLRCTRAAGRAALVWLVLAALQLVLSAADVLGVPPSQLTDPTYLHGFVSLELGRALVVQLVVILIITLTVPFALSLGGAALGLVLSLGAWLPVALTGHAATSDNHSVAVVSLAVHILSMALWCGGLAAILLILLRNRQVMVQALGRFSALALWCVVALAASGIVNAAIRLDSPAELVTTDYGRIVILKALLLVALVGFGYAHRKRLAVAADAGTSAWFVRAGTAEVLVMSAAVGLGVALSRTPPPAGIGDPGESAVRRMLGFDLPPAPTLQRMLWGEARVELFFLAAAILLVALYVAGLRVLARRGDSWPWTRTAAFLLGAVLLVVATSGGWGTYSMVLFSAHMIQHMTLNMLVPIFFVLGAPITLALRTLPAGRGPREWLLAFLHSRFVGFVSHPLVATAIFVGSFYVLYFTELFPVLMRSHWGHVAMNIHFILAGALFFWVLIGVDPGPKRPPYVLRMVLLLAAMPMHAFFSIAVMSSTSVLGESFFTALHRPYVTDLLADQRLGAQVGWAMGEIPMLIVVIALAAQWARSDEQAARRFDRQADRAAAGDERAQDELADYNAYLSELARRDHEAR